MALETAYAPLQYLGSGVSGQEFSITFPFLAAGDIVVEQDDGDGYVALVLNTNYTVARNETTRLGTVTMLAAVTLNDDIRISRSTEVIQPFSFPESGPIPSRSIEAALDRNAMILQEGIDGGTQAAADVTPVGTVIQGFWVAAPTGYVLLNGSSIGNAASGATYAAADATALFSLMWASVSNDYAAVSTGRGANAAADFAANKTLTLPDIRERVAIGYKATESIAGVAAVMGATLGEHTHQLTASELPVVAAHIHNSLAHVHTIPVDNSGSATSGSTSLLGSVNAPALTINTGTDAGAPTDANGGFGADAAHNNVQRSICMNFAIKL